MCGDEKDGVIVIIRLAVIFQCNLLLMRTFTTSNSIFILQNDRQLTALIGPTIINLN